MKRPYFAAFAAIVALSFSAFAQQAPTPPPTGAPPTASNASIAGTMEINYITRTPQGTENGQPIKGKQDQYKLDLTVNGTNQFQGVINRQPRIKQLGVRTIQEPRYDYNINLFVALKNGQKPNVGTWVGPMAVEEQSGAFVLEQQGDRALRLAITAGSGFTAPFGGRFYGKAADKSKLSFDSIKRTVNGKVVEKKFQADPMRFDGTQLARGPNPKMYPQATAHGELSFDRETGNYFAKGLKFDYQTPEGKAQSDQVSGTIKWVEDPQRAQNGKGFYEFNLRYNEEKNTPAKSDEQAFGGASDDDLFFAVDKSIPALVGRIDYVDNFAGSVAKDSDGKALPTVSKVTYALSIASSGKAEEDVLAQQRVMNFAKLWLIAVGPANDE